MYFESGNIIWNKKKKGKSELYFIFFGRLIYNGVFQLKMADSATSLNNDTGREYIQKTVLDKRNIFGG
jgi:hypothetical protein